MTSKTAYCYSTRGMLEEMEKWCKASILIPNFVYQSKQAIKHILLEQAHNNLYDIA